MSCWCDGLGGVRAQGSVRDVETMDTEELRAELRLARVRIAELVQENAALKQALVRAPPRDSVVCSESIPCGADGL